MTTGRRNDPLRAYNFLVELDGITRAAFRECSGLDSSQNAIDYREGGEPLRTRKLPGLNTYTNITLRWGITTDPEFWEWRRKAAEGRVERKNGSVVLLDDTGREVMRWNFTDAWPSKWSGPTLNATGNEVAIESVEIIHEGVSRA